MVWQPTISNVKAHQHRRAGVFVSYQEQKVRRVLSLINLQLYNEFAGFVRVCHNSTNGLGNAIVGRIFFVKINSISLRINSESPVFY